MNFYSRWLLVVTLSLVSTPLLLTACGSNVASDPTNETVTGNLDNSGNDNNGNPADSGNGETITDPLGGGDIRLDVDATPVDIVFVQTITNSASTPVLNSEQVTLYKQALRAYIARLTWGRVNVIFQELPTVNMSAVLNDCPSGGVNFPTIENWVVQNIPQISSADTALVIGRWSCSGSIGAAGRQPHRYMALTDNIASLNTSGLDPNNLQGFASIFRGIISSLGSSAFGSEKEGRTFHNNYPQTGSYGNPATDYALYGGRWSIMGEVFNQITALNSAYLSPWNYINMDWNVLRSTDFATYTNGTMSVNLGRYNGRSINGARVLNISQLIDNPTLPWLPDYFETMVTLRKASTDQHYYLIGELGKNPYLGGVAIQIFSYDLTTTALPLHIDFTATSFTRRMRLTVNSFDPITETTQMLITPLP